MLARQLPKIEAMLREAADEVTAFAGCDGLEATCDGKFDRLDSYIGFPRIPWRNPTGGID